MGVYVYKVTGKKVKLSNGKTANVARFAHRAFGFGVGYTEAEINRIERESGVTYCEKMAKEGKRLKWVVLNEYVL